ncbi:hypothetical protein RvY_11377 [Ramazzottius varieornatus]|uniref:histone acetyltransferase n=1 Tax=Ramazzottius varieornatus TaxID=947166 RepID=A0A1D1VIC4_RAMVA|nr:hypothetical protein RvY_11377 [Ramazzottius varieornatus]
MSSVIPSLVSSGSYPTVEESRRRRETIRRHLLVFVYAERCREGSLPYANHSGLLHSDAPPAEMLCTDSYCLSIRQLLYHMNTCRNGRNCTVTNCATTTAIFGHWKSCVAAECPVCLPIRDILQRPNQDEIVARAFATVNSVPPSVQAVPAQSPLNLSTTSRSQLPPQSSPAMPGAFSQPLLTQMLRRKLSSSSNSSTTSTSPSSAQTGPSPQPHRFQIPLNIAMRTGKARRVLSDNLLRQVFGPLYEPNLKSVAIYYSIVVQIEAVEEAIFAATGHSKESYDKAIADHLPVLRQQFHEQLKVLSESFEKSPVTPENAQCQNVKAQSSSTGVFPASALCSSPQVQCDEFSRRPPGEYLDQLASCNTDLQKSDMNQDSKSDQTTSENSPIVSTRSPPDLTNTAPGNFPLEQPDSVLPYLTQADTAQERSDSSRLELPPLRIDETVEQIEYTLGRVSPVRSPETTSAETESLPVPERVLETWLPKSIVDMLPVPSFLLNEEDIAFLRKASASSGISLERFCAEFTTENIRQAEKDVELMYRFLGMGYVVFGPEVPE